MSYDKINLKYQKESNMLKPIARTDDIFKSESFMRDSVAFNVMVSIVDNIVKYPTPKVFSNGSDCIIVCSDSKHPVIIWNTDEFNDFDNAFKFIQTEFSENTPFKIMSKMGLYDFLKSQNKIDTDNSMFLGVYECTKLKEIKYIGRPDNITEDEIERVAELWALFGTETGEDKKATPKSSLSDARLFTDSPLHKVWRDPDNKIVAITRISESEKYARIGHVITDPEERGKSYAKMLVHFMTQYALDTGKRVVLFTNFDYEPSNKCYVAVGYELICTIANYGIK